MSSIHKEYTPAFEQYKANHNFLGTFKLKQYNSLLNYLPLQLI